MSIFSNNIPSGTGVYFFKDQKGQALYIGKATNLKNRINSYRRTEDPRLKKMIKLASRLNWQKTNSEVEALILESRLIKKHRPKFNIMLRDDKQYGFVAFSKEIYSTIFTTHQPTKNQKPKTKNRNDKAKFKNSEYEFIGPFTDIGALKAALRLLRKIFPYCTCKQKHNNYCLNYHIGNCPGFCCLKNPEAISMNQETKIYKNNVSTIKKILSGKKNKIARQFKKEVGVLAQKEKFEEAHYLQTKVDKLEKIFENAKIIHSSSLTLTGSKYGKNNKVAVKELAGLLNLPTPPNRIEGYDIANIHGRHAAGAMAVFTGGKPDKSQYRKFKIKTKLTPDDPAMLKEVLDRRLKHDEWPAPDLIIVDGGKAQLQAAKTAISSTRNFQQRNGFKTANPYIITLTKDKRHKGSHIYTDSRKLPLLLKKLPREARNLILAVDAEAHRFAISYYRKLHRKSL